MLKRKFMVLSLLVIGLMGGLTGCMNQSSRAPVPARHKKSNGPQKSDFKLTSDTINNHPRILYAAIIYYAIHDVPIQRWQEVADMDAGWQIEIYPGGHGTRYLVWPGKHISDREKQLTPNWFRLSTRAVSFHSFEVHTDRQDADQHVRVGKQQILVKINDAHAAATVKKMSRNMTVLTHK